MPHFPTKRPIKQFYSRSLNQKILTISISLILIIFLSNTCLAQTNQHTFKLLNRPDGSKAYQLTIAITETLYEYFQSINHQIYSNNDLAKFVTPSPLEPVANDLWTIYNNPEDFANGVLMITHQIPYQESTSQKYPIETITENEGDCDLFSFIAASIMKAGGLDVTLLLFEEQEHMTIGVHLPETPKDARTAASYFTHNEKRYFIAECTGNLENGWRVGECPDLIQGATAQIITLDEINEITPPDKVSSSYSSPQYSSLHLSVSTEFAIAQSNIQIIGFLSPSLEGENITIYFSSYGSALTKLTTVETNSNGSFSHTWNSPPGGIYSIRANWSGDANYIGSDSSTSPIIIIPFQWLMMGAIVLFFLMILLIVSLATRGNETPNMESLQDWESNTRAFYTFFD
jgi:hypothetical protein